ncbi:glycosyltransferase [Jidongwangia harbinensis]|uniref:glycosyltransferase n=1 Tax=Jidongwangia harbinensis TaxID=2878561 RepID=UPI001CD92C0B|nr:glycosyltransferase [Jidongwangia harbinensis]MCA2213270.1 glycosyltransferase [Jidongwangia harbinensis]
MKKIETENQTAANVLVVYQHLPHYRYGVFKHLDHHSALEVTFIADVASRDGSIPAIPACNFKRFKAVRNIWRGQALWQSGLLRMLMTKQYQIVIFLGDAAYLTTWLGAMLARLTRRRVYFWTIGWHRPEGGLKRCVRLLFYRIAHRLLLYSQENARIGIEAGYPANRISVIGNSYESHLTSAEAEQDDADLRKILPARDETVISAVIRVDDQRRFDILLRAIEILASKGRDVVFVLVGEGQARPKIEHEAAIRNVDLRTLGATYSRYVLEQVYSRTTLTVIPAKAGLTTIQSLSYGVPVITSDAIQNQGPETAAILPGVTGDFFADGSAEDLAVVIERWLPRLERGRSDIASRCRAEIEDNWSSSAHARRIVEAVLGDVETKLG